ncbi:hypothetical protein DVH05_005928 [Phytophthora capsici]|nr:hypothetical protein DVH05_005928 [Phytophthora capsici]
MHGYAVIIFIHHTFAIFMSVLSKFVIFSSAVHQLIVTIGISTASLGVCLVLIGSFMLAGLASYLHMPVIGRYLAVIGVFCLYAGLTINTHNLLLCATGFLGGATLLLVSQNFKNPFALSTAIMIMPVLFFIVLATGRISLEDARENDWVDPVENPASITDLFSIISLSFIGKRSQSRSRDGLHHRNLVQSRRRSY